MEKHINTYLKESLVREIWEWHNVPTPRKNNGPVKTVLHYGDTIELLFTNGVIGEVFINQQKYTTQEKTLFFIPPRHLHKMNYFEGGKFIKVLHIDLEKLRNYIDIESILNTTGQSLNSISHTNHNFDKIFNLATAIADKNSSIFKKLSLTIEVFNSLTHSSKRLDFPYKNKIIPRLITWAEENYSKKLSIKIAADYFGFSKDYFSHLFSTNFGVSFTKFINSVRINHACSFLIDGHTIEETSELCGYSDPSYFIKIFKQLCGTTPKKYVFEQRDKISYKSNVFL